MVGLTSTCNLRVCRREPSDYDSTYDTGKAPRLGFCESVDTEENFLHLFTQRRAEQIIP